MQRVRADATPKTGASGDVADLSDLAQRPSIAGAVEAVKEFLGMDVAFAAEIVDGRQVFRVLRGDGESFGVGEGLEIPMEQTYCQRVLDGRLPNIVADVRAEPRAAELPITELADVGSFVSVPLTFSDGRLYGTLCAGSHETSPDLGYRELQFLHVFARIVADQLERDQLQARTRDLELQATAASALIAAVEARDAYTSEHSQAVVEHAIGVARRLELSEAEIDDVRHVALLHDIGKIAVPDTILLKPGALDEGEWETMRLHPVFSERMVRNIPGLEHLGSAVRAEHERWDGTGYPDGLAGEAIPLASRITLVCDAYDAMTSDRPYRPALPVATAREEIARGMGSQFCPTAAQALLDVLATPERP
jgi:response regulator RpfG family c-di-GMP phosphodiesterase